MVETILTPTALWKNFELPENVGANVVQEQKKGNVIVSKFFIEGRSIEDGKVSIYAQLMRTAQNGQSPAIILVEDFSMQKNSELAKDLLSKGYAVLTVDLAGCVEGKKNYTIYPESISYANYSNAKEDIYLVEKDAKHTCWYEWCAVLKYAIKYLKGLPFISKVGGFGVSTVATALWQVLGTDQNLDVAIIALNSGWIGYKGIYKFGGVVEPQFTDKMYMFIAGVDSQSYAMHIKTPTLLLSATNDNNFEVDRAQDIMSKIPEDVYGKVYLSENNVYRINKQAYNNALLFFNKYLCDKQVFMPAESDIKCDLVDGEFIIEVQTDPAFINEIASVEVFVAEEQVNPVLRCWQRINAKGKKGIYKSSFIPYNQAEIVFAYANVEYKNGLKLSTNIVSKRFNIEQVKNTFKSNVLYSSRQENAESIFSPARQSSLEGESLGAIGKEIIKEKKGPMGIVGITCSGGLLTFALANKKYKPKNGSMLMLDVYMKEQACLTVKLISDYFGEKTEYFVKVNLLGGDVWHNARIEMNKFKTAEGMVLKDYSKIEALEISADDGEYLINNALWV